MKNRWPSSLPNNRSHGGMSGKFTRQSAMIFATVSDEMFAIVLALLRIWVGDRRK